MVQQDDAPDGSPIWIAGLRVRDLGHLGLVFEPLPELDIAHRRFDRVLAYLDEESDAATYAERSGRLLLCLIANEAVLTVDGLKCSTASTAQLYAASEGIYLEWSDKSGWQDRRLLSRQTACCKAELGDDQVTPVAWRWVKTKLLEICPEYADGDPLGKFMTDAIAWWWQWSSPDLLAHATSLRRRNLHSRAVLARKATGLAQAEPMHRAGRLEPGSADMFAPFLAVRRRSGDSQVVEALAAYAAEVGRDKVSKEEGRRRILTRVDLLLPKAAEESRRSVLLLLAVRHAIQAGGATGRNWSPGTIAEYLQCVVRPMRNWSAMEAIESQSGSEIYHFYLDLLEQMLPTQRRKGAAFLQVFHRVLTLMGAEALPAPLVADQPELPSAAGHVSPVEAELACGFVVKHAPATERIRLQAQIIIRLGLEVPIRTYEYWLIRIGDLDPYGATWLTIYPRRRDGLGKTPFTRRTEEIQCAASRRLLLDLVDFRRHREAASDEDLLFGEPLVLDVAHEQVATERLVNAALRWATGDSRASLYDLRHTCFGRRESALNDAASFCCDLAGPQVLSIGSGHAASDSKRSYLHEIEVELAKASKIARSRAWSVGFNADHFASGLPHVAQGLVRERPEQNDKATLMVNAPAELDHSLRLKLLGFVQDGFAFQPIAHACRVTEKEVDLAVSALAQVLSIVGRAEEKDDLSRRSRCLAIARLRLWERASWQPKFNRLVRALDALWAVNDRQRLRLAWEDWRACQREEWIGLEHSRAAERLIRFLMDGGVPPTSLATTSDIDAPDLPASLSCLSLAKQAPVTARSGRPRHRLVLTEESVAAEDAQGASISMVGMHWHFLVLGSCLLAKGEI